MADVLEGLRAALADRYRIERELGAGGMATVYLAHDLKHDRPVALKVLRQELAAALGAERFHREIQIAAKLQHPNILPLHDSGDAGGFLYYVMPYVEGQSLRERLAREGALPVGDAVRILRDVVDALTEAHAHGVVHRDIKPENIMLRGHHALVTDFGVAKAVSEATGRQTLTTAGVALGTPAYMAPEQASADPHLDQRVDIYAVGAVAYELLTGRPVFMGTTPQMVLSAHVADAPVPVTKYRETVPRALEALVMRCLEKQPADRWQSVEELLPQLEALATPSGGITPTDTRPVAAVRRRRLLSGALVAGVALVAAVAALLVSRTLSRRHAPVRLGLRTQLTFSGNALWPAISGDGKQLAFWTKTCTSDNCTYALHIQDVGSTITHRVLDGATAAYAIEWALDRRNLLVSATIGGRFGYYLVSVLGGAPRYVLPREVEFLGDGDSLVVGDFPGHSDTLFWVRILALDGTTRDSIRVGVPHPARVSWVDALPRTSWIVSGVPQATGFLFQILDRHGRVADRLLDPCVTQFEVSGDALWIECGALDAGATVRRVAVNAATGRLSVHHDTVYTGPLHGFTVTADGGSFVVSEGTAEYSVWALDLPDALRGHFPESQRIVRATTPVYGKLSPDGSQLLMIHTMPAGPGRTEARYTIRPFAGGTENVIHVPGTVIDAGWTDAGQLRTLGRVGAGLQLSVLDPRSSTVVRSLSLPDSGIGFFDVLPDGWAYIPDIDRVMLVRGGQRREVRSPSSVLSLGGLVADRGGRIIATGWSSSFDSLVVLQVPSDGGAWTVWATLPAEGGGGVPLWGGGVLVTAFQSQQSATLYLATAPGRLQKLGTVPRPIDWLSPSRDGRRATVLVRDYHGDAWMSQVVRP